MVYANDEEEKRKVLAAVSQMYDADQNYRQEISISVKADNFSRFRGLVNRAAAEIGGMVHEVTVTAASAAWTFVKSALFGKGSYNSATKNDSCFVASSVYHNKFAYEVDVLRKFRDMYLSRYYIGKIFVWCYYHGFGKLASRIISGSPFLKRSARRVLDWLVEINTSNCGKISPNCNCSPPLGGV